MDSLVVSHQTVSDRLGLVLPRQLRGETELVMASPLQGEARDAAILRCLDELASEHVKVSGQHRLGDWNTGWAEHERLFDSAGLQGLVPRYFAKHPYARIDGEFAESASPLLELRLLRLLQEVVGHTFLGDLDDIVEFGCGTGHNLIHAHMTYAPKSRLLGLDWAESSQDLLARVSLSLGTPLKGRAFNYFDPHSFSPLPENSGVMTMCSLEQVGAHFQDFVQYLLEQKPAIVVHIEPMPDLLDPSRLMDWLSIEYARKRAYLDGFLPYLVGLQENRQLEILLTSRSGVGSFFIDGYQVCVWRPRSA